MVLFKRFSLVVFIAYSLSAAGNSYHSFSFAPAFPVSDREAETRTSKKALANGWEAGWTFFGKPFHAKENILSELAFGGKISYSRWLRDSTATPVGFLGVQAISRYYFTFLKPVNIFLQGGAGLFLGEYSFTSPDTTDFASPPTPPIVIELKSFGYHFGFGLNWDVLELVPLITVVPSKEGLSAWLSINAAMTF